MSPFSYPKATQSLADVRKVTLCFVGGGFSSYLVLASELDRFVEASKRLHFQPGRNPHNGVEAARIWQITVGEFELRGPFWWTVPDLQNNGDPRGARVIDVGIDHPVWQDEAYIARSNAEEAEAEAAYYRAQERRAVAASAQGGAT